jgi:mono/diheme cytochrome c family protein
VELDPGPVPAELAAAERLFEARCASCHGRHAAGSETGPPLVHIYYEPNHHADIAFQRAVAYGVRQHHWSYGSMPAVPGLDEGQVASITAYVRWLQRQAGIY